MPIDKIPTSVFLPWIRTRRKNALSEAEDMRGARESDLVLLFSAGMSSASERAFFRRVRIQGKKTDVGILVDRHPPFELSDDATSRATKAKHNGGW